MKERAKTAELTGSGNTERWIFDDASPAKRCFWPTADCAARLVEVSSPGARAVLLAYYHLLTHPIGTEEMILRLRDLRRAEREGGFR